MDGYLTLMIVANRIFGKRDIHRQNRRRMRAGEPVDVPRDYWRPTSRKDCRDGPRPCPFVACKHHLFLDVTPRGGLRVPYGDDPAAIDQMQDTCALDVAERGGVTLEAVARLQGITRERVRQIELVALRRLRLALRHIIDDEGVPSMPPVDDGPAVSLTPRPRPDLGAFLTETITPGT